MIKKIIANHKKKQAVKDQEKLIEYLDDKKTMENATAGSMQKRNELIKRVDTKLKHA